jgi:hypothetical protein
MASKVDKVILTNIQGLQRKYGTQGAIAVERAVKALIASDEARGLHTRLVPLDDKAEMHKLKAPPVTKPIDPRQNKRAVDAVFRTLGPDYLAILGSADVIPHQDLKNPVHGPDDEDVFAFGDIPYACEAPYSRNPQDFVGPTRVVGRIPDVTAGKDPSYLVGLLKTAADYAPVKPAAFDDYFAVTAQVWRKSTRLSVSNVFGGAPEVASVPPRDASWPKGVLRARAHFFNCHGATGDPRFYGEPDDGTEEYPTALDAAYVDGKLGKGTIAAAECCYGGELYGLSPTRPVVGLCNTYLANEAYGFFASTSIAYGPAEGNGQADLICQYFLLSVLEGASLGRAALEARQRFVRTSSPPDPFDLKTLAQFNLYGDPSLTPVERTPAFVVAAHALAERVERNDRRRGFFREGVNLASNEPVPKRTKVRPPQRIANRLRAAAQASGTKPASALSFKLHYPDGFEKKAKSTVKEAMPLAYAAKATLPTSYHVLFARPAGATPSAAEPKAAQQKPKILRIVAFIGKEVAGELVSIREIHRR